jgi:hypothetical protein
MTIAIDWSLMKCPCPSWSVSTDESALRSSLASLDKCNSSQHWWLGFWTFLVALGVALEVVFVVREYLDALHDFNRGVIHAPERPPTVLFLLGLLGASLVAVGVTGEVWKGSDIATVETCIRKANDALFLLLSKEAGDAKDSAKVAKLAADGAKESANAAGVAASKAEAKAEAVAKRAEQIDAELAQTEQLMSARSIQSRDELADKIKEKFKGRNIVLKSYIGDQEAGGLCTQFLYVTTSAEMKPVNQCGMSPLEVPLVSPFAVSGPDTNETVELGTLITTIGRIAGWSAIKAPVLTILVGVKPSFMIGQARRVNPPTKNQTKEQGAKP